MVTAQTLKPMYFSNSFSNCFSWQNFFSSIINCWQADRINTPAFKKPSNDLVPSSPASLLGRRASGPRRVGGGLAMRGDGVRGEPATRGPTAEPGPSSILTSSAWARSWVSSACLRCAAFFWVTVSTAAHLQLEIQAAHEIMNSLRADCEIQARYQRTHTYGSVTH